MRSLIFFLSLFLFATLAPSQTVTVGNWSPYKFAGWTRCTVDVAPPATSGTFEDGTKYITGKTIGAVRNCDIWVRLDPGVVRKYDLAQATPGPVALSEIPVSQLGWPSIAGVPMLPASDWLAIDGACLAVHLHARVGPMLHVDLWVRAYGGQGWYPGEVVVTASNGAVPDVVATVPAGFTLTCGDAITAVPGQPWGSPLLPEGETLADGQARSFPFVVGWPKLMPDSEAMTSSQAQAELRVLSYGLNQATTWGTTMPGRGFDSRAWANSHFGGAVTRLHGWDGGPIGVTPASGRTGAQEDQGALQGAEAQQVAGPSAAVVRYLAALGQSRRPMHHLEADGTNLDLSKHPRLIMWSSRAHWHTGVSPDQLGKSRQPTEAESRGWYGPDREHWLINTLAAGHRATGSPALQWQLRHHAINFLAGETVTPGWSTSGTDAARSVGWAGIVVSHLWDNLEDRQLAERVAERWRQRVRQVYIPYWGNRPGGIWDFRQDGRLTMDLTGYTLAWMPYQQAIGSYGGWLACSKVGPDEGLALFTQGALTVVRHAYRNGIEWEILGYRNGEMLPDSEYVERKGAHRTGWFRHAWFPPALWVAAFKAGDAQARTIWDQLVSEASAGTAMLAWFPPVN